MPTPRSLIRVACASVAAFLLIIAAWEATWLLSGDIWGRDYGLYMRDAQRFLSTGTPYAPEQLASPYPIFGELFLYPPTALALMVPFAFLPAVLWWVVPLGIIAWCLYRWRPGPLAWPVLAFVLVWPRTLGAVAAGNTDLWIAALIAAGLVRGWPLAFVLIKPSVAPLLLLGVRTWRRTAVGIGAMIVVGLVTLPLWPQYLTSLGNLRDPSPWLAYSLPNLPLLLVPVVAWLGRARDPDVKGHPIAGTSSARVDVAVVARPVGADRIGMAGVGGGQSAGDVQRAGIAE